MKYKQVKIDELHNFKFIIPKYQRGYVWNKKQYSNFYQDVICNGNWGGVILLKEKGNNVFEVIDGQQRLTTLVSYLEKTDIISNDNENYNLSKINTNHTFDNIYLKNIKDCFDYFKSLTKNKCTNEEVISFLIVEQDNNKININDMFDSLNTKGIKLTNLEIIKNKIYHFVSLSKLSDEEKNRRIKSIDDMYFTIFNNLGKIQSLSTRWKNDIEDKLLWMHWLTYKSFVYTRAVQQPVQFTLFTWFLNTKRLEVVENPNRIVSIYLSTDGRSLVFQFEREIDPSIDIRNNLIFNSVLNYEFDTDDISEDKNILKIDCTDEEDLKIWKKKSYIEWLKIINSHFVYKKISENASEFYEYIVNLMEFSNSFLNIIKEESDRKIIFLSCLPDSWLAMLIFIMMKNKKYLIEIDVDFLYKLAIKYLKGSINKNSFMNPHQKLIDVIKKRVVNNQIGPYESVERIHYSLRKYFFLYKLINTSNFVTIAKEMFHCDWISNKSATIEHMYPLHRTADEREYRNILNDIGNLCIVPRDLNDYLGDSNFIERTNIINKYKFEHHHYKEICDDLINFIQVFIDRNISSNFIELSDEEKECIVQKINERKNTLIS